MSKIIDISGEEKDVDCIACEIQSGKINLPVTRIAENEYFVVEQDLEFPIDGFLIIVSKRHIHGIAEFSEEEDNEFMKTIKRCRQIMEKALGIEKITIVQEEASSSSHFHVWLFPWHDWMLKKVEPKIENIHNMMNYAKKKLLSEQTLKQLEETAQKMKKIF